MLIRKKVVEKSNTTDICTIPSRQAVPAITTEVRCLLVTSNFAPVHGGSAVVYASLCQYLPTGSIRVLAARRNYLNEQEIPGWREHDAGLKYPVDRVEFLRPPLKAAPANILVSAWRLFFQDIPLHAHVLWSTARLVRRHRINVVCIGELVSGSWLGIALRALFGCKLMIYTHGEEITQVTESRLSGEWRRPFLHAADKVVAVSSFTRDALTRLMNLPAEQIALIPNGVDTKRFSPGPVNQALMDHHRWAGKKIVLSVGRLVPRKGTDMAVRAMAQVIQARQDVHYLIVGEGALRAELETLIAEYSLQDHVSLVGDVGDAQLLEYLRLCDLFLLPNRTMPDGDTEGFGLVFREANACGKAVIGGRAGGVVEAVVDGHSGLLVDGWQPADIAAAILKLLNDDALRQNIAAQGLALARKNTTQAMAHKFLKVCEQVLQTKKKR